MSERLPYEESLNEKLQEIPVPDEEQSWQQMKLLLEDDDDNRRILPPVFLNSCLGWGFLLLLIAILWFFLQPQKWWKKENTHATEKVQSPDTITMNHKIDVVPIDDPQQHRQYSIADDSENDSSSTYTSIVKSRKKNDVYRSNEKNPVST